MDLMALKEASRTYHIGRYHLEGMVRDRVIPVGVSIHLGRRVFLNRQLFEEFLINGGAQLPGGWKRRVARAVKVVERMKSKVVT